MNYGLSGRYKVMVIDAKTKRIKRQDRKWHNNLIMNSGMDKIATALLCDCFTHAIAGSDPTPGNRVSSLEGTSATGSASNGAVVLSGGTMLFNLVSPTWDLNNIIKWDNTGIEGRLDAVAGATNATILPWPVASQSGTFVIYRTNLTKLGTEIVRTNNYLPVSPWCGTTAVGNLLIHQRTWDFPAETSTKTYLEMGVGWNGTLNDPSVFARFLLSSVTVVNAGEQLRLIYQLRVVMDPYDDTTKTAAVTGWATTLTGKERVQLLGMSSVSSVGATTNYDAGYYCNEPSRLTNVNAWLSTDATANAAYGSCIDRHTGMPTLGYGALTSPDYVTHSYTRTRIITFGTGQGNSSTIKSMGLGWNSGSNNPASANSICFVFDYNQEKTSSYTLDMQWFNTWGRVLSPAAC
jgi:hypothetical protein